jgi:polar amino acid transport system substrate-binding protein
VAVPTDFPPYGFVGVDMAPQGLDIDMARLIADKLGVKAGAGAGEQPQPHPYLQSKKVDLVISTLGKNPEREGHQLQAAYSPFFQGVFGPSRQGQQRGRPGRQDVAVTRGAIEDQELTKLAPAGTDIKRFEDNNATVAAFVSHQTQLIATGVSVAE